MCICLNIHQTMKERKDMTMPHNQIFACVIKQFRVFRDLSYRLHSTDELVSHPVNGNDVLRMTRIGLQSAWKKN